MRISPKFRHLLSLSVLCEILHHPHFRFKLRRKNNRVSLRSWSSYGITIYKIYHWQKGKFWSSYYALFSGASQRVGYSKAAVSYALTFEGLEDELFFIWWKYDGHFIEFLQDMYDNDFTDDDIPDDVNEDIPF